MKTGVVGDAEFGTANFSIHSTNIRKSNDGDWHGQST